MYSRSRNNFNLIVSEIKIAFSFAIRTHKYRYCCCCKFNFNFNLKLVIFLVLFLLRWFFCHSVVVGSLPRSPARTPELRKTYYYFGNLFMFSFFLFYVFFIFFSSFYVMLHKYIYLCCASQIPILICYVYNTNVDVLHTSFPFSFFSVHIIIPHSSPLTFHFSHVLLHQRPPLSSLFLCRMAEVAARVFHKGSL